MTNTNDARRAHDVLDGLFAGRILSRENEQLLRSFLPELPKQLTLEEIAHDVYDAWGAAYGNDWADDVFGELEDWLRELHEQLKGLIDSKPASPALPEGICLADHEEYGRVVVSPKPNDIGQYKIFHLDDSYVSGADVNYVEADALTFIDAEPAHPEFLETEADYESAPEGAVVVEDGGVPCHKFQSTWSSVAFLAMKDDRGMSRARRRVLRWGK